MIIGRCFPGDDDEMLMLVQHELYGPAVGHLFWSARRSFQKAARMLEAETVLGMIIGPIESFDHRTLQEAHDIIAAAFRRNRPDLLQPFLTLDMDEHRCRLVQEWRDYYPVEMARLVELPPICRAVLTAVAYQNTEVGYRAEDELRKWLHEEYEPLEPPPEYRPRSRATKADP